MAENLKTTRYANGEEIRLVENGTDWNNLGYNDEAFGYYDNSLSNKDIYGALYTWAAAMNGAESSNFSIQGVCPDGWHLPSDDEWIELIGYVQKDGYSDNDGDALKSRTGWNENSGFDFYAFNALPAGIIYNDAYFSYYLF